MGAEMSIATSGHVEKDMNELTYWFQQLAEDDQYRNGHEGYTGGFSTVSGVKDLRASKEFASVQEAEEWLDENCDKWGPCLVVAVRDEERPLIVMGALCSS